ncbi:MAG: SGNH/GDSL hydrolase family protein [Polyangiaceae bacterium]
MKTIAIVLSLLALASCAGSGASGNEVTGQGGVAPFDTGVGGNASLPAGGGQSTPSFGGTRNGGAGGLSSAVTATTTNVGRGGTGSTDVGRGGTGSTDVGRGGTSSGGSATGGRSSGGTAGNVSTGGSSTAGRTSTSPVAGAPGDKWVGSWVTAQQLTEEANKPPAPGLAQNTLRQVVHTSIGGSRLRVRFSNEYGSSPITLTKAAVAKSAGGHNISTGTSQSLTFDGKASVTIAAKAAVYSDPFDFALEPLSNVAISILFGSTSNDVTGHPGSRATSYIQSGDGVAAAALTSPKSTDHWYVISGIDVLADAATHAIVILGDSITDGRGSTTNGNDRWPDALARRLQANATTKKIAVLNQGIGGNTILSGGLGPTALTRFDNDVLKQNGVSWLIVLEGVNDIGGSSSTAVATNLINAYEQFVTKAHAANIRVYGVPILPFSGNSYYSTAHETARKTVNDWIRTPGNFDAVLDLDAAVRDPQSPERLLSTYDSGDHLHLNPAGYQKMADAIALTLFAL